MQDLILCDWDVLQNDLQSHGHHTGQPVHHTGVHLCRHGPLERNSEKHSRSVFTTYSLVIKLKEMYCLQKQAFTDDAVVDDCSKGCLLSSQAVQIEGQALKQRTVTQLQQVWAKRVI